MAKLCLSHQSIAAAPSARRAFVGMSVMFSYLLVAFAAFLPRILDLGVFITVDEASFWIRRSTAFMEAIRSGDFAATAIAPHPGVTTMWLGGAGQLLYDALLQRHILTDTSYQAFLAWQQLPVALVHIIGILVGYLLLRRLFSPMIALLGALLWSFDPFAIGYSRVLHVDMLAGTFLMISLLAACVYWQQQEYWWWLVCSAVCGALALLSKLPGAAIVPLVGLIALWTWWQPLQPQPSRNTFMRIVGQPLLLWGVVFVATLLIMWPAIWSNPAGVYDMLRFGVVSEGGEAHEQGNFFLGQAIDAPGALFYPVTLALRTTPWSLLGVLVLPVVYWLWPRTTRRHLALLAALVLVITIPLSLSPKKFNRYLVPAFPAVDILAAAGLIGIGQGAGGLLKSSRGKHAAVTGVFVASSLAAGSNAAWWHPYGIAAFNQALGGAAAGANTFLIGWGEGLQETAAWLNQQPDITGVSVATTLVDPLQRYLKKGAQSSTPDANSFDSDTGYVVVYVRSVQDGAPRPPFDQFYGHDKPLHVTTIHDVPYAWVYQMPQPVATPRPAQFGTLLQLRGFSGDARLTPGKPLQLQLFWHVLQPGHIDQMLFVHLIGDDGKQYANVDLPLPISTWTAHPYVDTSLPLPLPANLPSRTYHLTLGVYDAATGKRLPLTTSVPDGRAADGDDAFNLAELK